PHLKEQWYLPPDELSIRACGAKVRYHPPVHSRANRRSFEDRYTGCLLRELGPPISAQTAIRGLCLSLLRCTKNMSFLENEVIFAWMPMGRLLQPLLVYLSVATDRELARQVQFLREENRILRGRLPDRINVTPRERRRLVKFGAGLGPVIREL